MAGDQKSSSPRPSHAPRTAPSLASVVDQFRAALVARDIVPPEPILADGCLHRCDAAGKHGRGDAAYVLHMDGLPAGGLENWRDGRGWESWRFDSGRELSPGEHATIATRTRVDLDRREAANAVRHRAAQARATRLWETAQPADHHHPYLVRKGVGAFGIRVYKGALVVPLRDAAGVLHSLQFITGGGTKRFLKGGRVAGLFCGIGDVGNTTAGVICVAEGYATGASIHLATGHPVAVAFHAGNLGAVAGVIRDKHPRAQLIICADDDAATPGNPGLTHARAAARAVDARLAVPAFGADRPDGATDFNDLHQLQGLIAVRNTLSTAAVEPVAGGNFDTRPPQASGTRFPEWPEPEPLTEPMDAQPYPVDALPTMLRDAVTEAQGFVQAPMALVACSALAALSLAAQGLANVRRDHQLVGPISLYLMAVADSGERKTTCDAIFGQALRDWETGRILGMAPAIAQREAAIAAYEAKKAGLLEAIKQRRRRAQDTTVQESELEDLVRQALAPLVVPRLIYADATPEALAHALANGWPSGGVLSAEAGAVFGAHGMGQDTILRNLALLNVLWDGGEMAIDRRSRPSFLLRGRRLTFGLMAQPEALRGFLERAGPLPRGTGFIARFLMAWPDSTQGQRPYRPAPATMPSVTLYAARIGDLLGQALAADACGGLDPPILDLAPQARAEWIQFHDGIERELGAHGEFRAVRDVAAKAAENAARLAALFHVLAHGPAGTIGVGDIDAAVHIVGWHLGEARRLLAELDTPPSMAAAIRFDAWLRQEARANGVDRVPTKRIYQYGPNCVRSSRDFQAALSILAERNRARLEEDGRRRYVVINTALLGNAD